MPADNPYPGPVPLSDPQLLKGRDQHVSRFVKEARKHRIVKLHGQSGVGKSSFLRAGAIPHLENLGYTVATVSAWEHVASLGDTVEEGLEPGNPSVASGRSLWLAAVDQALAKSAPFYRESLDDPEEYLEELASIDNFVVVFDQFEELLRSDEMQGRTIGTRFLEYAAEIANRSDFSVTQVLSLRSEYISELEPVRKIVPSHRWTFFEVPTVDFAATVPDIVRVDPTVSDSEVDDIHRIWNSAAYGQSEPRTGARPAIGLLELQAYLWRTAAPSVEGGPLPTSPNDQSHDEQAIDAFVDAMEFYVGHSLVDESTEYTERASDDVDAAPRGRETVVAAARLAPHLASAGYKLVRDTDDLAVSALPSIKDLRIRRRAKPDLAGLDEEGRDILARAGTIARVQSAGPRPSAKRNLPDHEAAVEEAARICRIGDLEEDVPRLAELFGRLWEVDAPTPKVYKRVVERLSGRMYGGDPLVAISELAANYERALKWMEERFVVRLTPTSAGGRVTALVHDGFGVPLSRWGRAHEARPATALSSLVAISGETVIDKSPETPLTTEEMLGGDVARVRWLGCEIQAGFEDVTFTECDFRGSIFVGATFRRVRFVDCNLWGVLFLHCTLDGCTFEGGPPLQTLTIRESNLTGEGVAFSDLPAKSYGLFFDAVAGGPWMLDSCVDLSHVSVSGQAPEKTKGNLHPGTIKNSKIKHLTLEEAVDPGTCLGEGATVVHVIGDDGRDSLRQCDGSP